MNRILVLSLMLSLMEKKFLLMVQLMLSIVTVYSYKHEYNR